ncbi:Tll0287-like domain-containing protein [Magnetofaba australis]|nr:DUF3365 domain-containing protein [Magnetofaba australis]
MKRLGVMTLGAALLLASPAFAAEDTEALAAEARGAVKAFFGNLKGTLVKGLKSGGPAVGVQVCSAAAKGIARNASRQYGGEVGRTSLKVRNPENAPDAWEHLVLQSFDARLAKGEDPKKMEHYEILNDGKTFRYMKAIPTAEKPCLMCHGEKISPEVQKILAEKYPDDKAVGYKAGQIRGAFTLQKALQ